MDKGQRLGLAGGYRARCAAHFRCGRLNTVRTGRRSVAILFLTVLANASAWGAETGASLYQFGRDGGPAVQVRLGDGVARFLATSFPCANCHGADGAGKREAGNFIPPIDGTALALGRSASAAFPARPAYNDETLARAVTEGIDAAGRRFSSAMPRYDLTGLQRAALIGYLKTLGQDDTREDGVSPTLIRVGTALPLSGPRAATGQAVRHMLDAMLTRASGSGIYGRRLELVTADTATEGTEAALSRLIGKDRVLALVATQLADGAVDPDIPVVGDLGGTVRPMSRRVFRIAAPIADRVSVLLWQLARCDGPDPRLAVVGAAAAPGRAALDRAAGTSLRVVLDWHDVARPDAAVAAASAAGAQAILVLADGQTLAALRAVGTTLPLLFPGQPDDDAVAGAAIPLPPGDRRPVRTAFAGFAPDQVDESGLRAVLARGPDRSIVLYEAYAAAAVLLEGLRQAGRRLDRAVLAERIAALRDFRTGVMPPIGFGPDRRDGLSGAAVIGFAADGNAVFLAPWEPAESLAPRDGACPRATDAER